MNRRGRDPFRVGVLGDLHLDLQGRGLDRFADVERQLHRFREVVLGGAFDAVVQLGDVTDPDSGWRTIRALEVMARFWTSLRPPHRVGGPHRWQLVGNHDVVDDERYLSALDPLSVHGVEVVVEPVLVPVDGRLFFLFVPYVSAAHLARGVRVQAWLDGKVAELLEGASAAARIVAFTHLDVDGAAAGSEGRMLRGGRLRVPEQLELDPRVELIVAGHVHKPQVVRRKILVVGSVERLDFGEAGDRKGYAVLEL